MGCFFVPHQVFFWCGKLSFSAAKPSPGGRWQPVGLTDEGKPGSVKTTAVKSFGAGLTLISPSVRTGAASPRGSLEALPRQHNHRKINDNLTFHLFPQEAGGGTGQALVRRLQGRIPLTQQQKHGTHQVTLA